MPCYPKYGIDGKLTGFWCGDFGGHCIDCHAIAENLCDFPVGDGKTCDRLMCGRCSNVVGVDLHYCRTHYKEWVKFRDSGGVKKVLENVVPFGKNK